MSDLPDSTNLPPPGLPPNSPPDPLAAKLARLDPAPAAIGRDRLLFRAGAESRRNVIRLWQVTAGFLAAMGFYAGTQYAGERVVYVEKPAASPTQLPPPVVVLPPAPENLAAPPPAPIAAPPMVVPPLPNPEPPASPAPPAGPFFVNTPDPSGVANWFQMRNDVLTAGLGVLPDPGRNPPRPKTGGPK